MSEELSERWDRVRTPVLSVVAVLLLVGGYLGAKKLATSEGDITYVTQRVITITRAPNLPPETITTTLPVKTLPGETSVVTVRRNGKNVLVRIPGPTVTSTRTVRVKGKTQTKRVRVVLTDTQVLTQVRDRLITRPGTTTTLPGSTITTPGQTQTVVREVAQPAVTETQIREITQPAKTVTDTQTQTVTLPPETVTQTQTVTHEVTVTQDVTVTVTAPPGP